MADLVRAMLADAVFNDRDAKDPIELSRLAGLSLARVSSALAAGESRGLFQRGPASTPTATGLSKTLWRLSPDLTDLATKFADFAEEGLRVAKLGEPVFLYLRFAEGLLFEEDAEAAL